MTWNEVWDKHRIYEDICDGGFKPTVQRVGKDHIFDEDKSVKWNREEVERVNNQYQQELNDFRRMKANAYSAVERAAVDYIMQELSVDFEKAMKIYNFCYGLKYDESFEAVLELVNDIIDVLE